MNILVSQFDTWISGNEGRGQMEAETQAGTWYRARERSAAHRSPCFLLPWCWLCFRTRVSRLRLHFPDTYPDHNPTVHEAGLQPPAPAGPRASLQPLKCRGNLCDDDRVDPKQHEIESVGAIPGETGVVSPSIACVKT